jgi:hypothetical protein
MECVMSCSDAPTFHHDFPLIPRYTEYTYMTLTYQRMITITHQLEKRQYITHAYS